MISGEYDEDWNEVIGGNDTNDYIYILSIREAMNPSYGFSSDTGESGTREARNTKYTKERGAYTNDGADCNGNWRNGIWRLRFPGGFASDQMAVSHVDTEGRIDRNGSFVDTGGYAVRPAFHINLALSNWTQAGTMNSLEDCPYDAVGGKDQKPAVIPDSNKNKNDNAVKNDKNKGKAISAPGTVKGLTAKNKKKKSVILTWKKVSGAKGYQIQYAADKKFKKKKCKVTKKTKYTLKKLKKKKTWYFRVRAYKLDGKKKIYGKCSKSKKIKIKK